MINYRREINACVLQEPVFTARSIPMPHEIDVERITFLFLTVTCLALAVGWIPATGILLGSITSDVFVKSYCGE